MGGALNRTYDDRDTEHLRYGGFWFNTGSYNASSVSQTGTLSSSSDVNATITFTFPEPANAFYYYAIPRCCGGSYAICIDCDPNEPIFVDIDGVNRTDDGKNPPVIMFSKTFADFGIHEIILKNQADTRFNNSQITVDRFVLQVEDPNAFSSSASTIGPSSAISTALTSSSSSAVTPSVASNSTVPLGAIVGASIGGVALIGALLALNFCLRRRRRPPFEPETSMSEPQPPQSHPRPFLATISSPLAHAKGSTSIFNSPTSEFVSTSSHRSQSLGDRVMPRRETDAGPLRDDEDDDESTLPPEYDAVFRSGRRQMVRDLSPVPHIPDKTS